MLSHVKVPAAIAVASAAFFCVVFTALSCSCISFRVHSSGCCGGGINRNYYNGLLIMHSVVYTNVVCAEKWSLQYCKFNGTINRAVIVHEIPLNQVR